MLVKDYIFLSIENTGRNIFRSSLAVVSIAIGIFSFVFVTSLNESMADKIANYIKRQGGVEVFTIFPGKKNFIFSSSSEPDNKKTYRFRKPVSFSLLSILKKQFPEIRFIPEFRLAEKIVTEEKNYQIKAISEAYFDIFDSFKIIYGRSLSTFDIIGGNHVILVPDFFPKRIGEYVRLGKYKYKIIGKLNSDNFQLKNNIFIPATAASPFRKGKQLIYGKYKDLTHIREKIASVQNYLNLLFGKNMFRIEANIENIQRYEEFTYSYSKLIMLFSILMLFTGGIGIMNIMLSSVGERIKEIGIRKAVGANNKAIFTQIFLETIIIFSMGTILGIGLAFLSIESAADLLLTSDLFGKSIKTTVTYRSILLSIITSGITGTIFGILPAFKASCIAPIESLRYE